MLWLFFIVWLAMADWHRMALATALLTVLLIHSGWREAVKYMRRSRWLLLIVWMVNMLGLPGEPLWQFGGIEIERPGMRALLVTTLATWHLVLILMALAVLMARLTRPQLLLAMYTLLQPWRMLGVQPQRVAVRIWLTLYYAEHMLAQARDISFRQRIVQLFDAPHMPENGVTSIALETQPFGWRDAACWAGVLGLNMGIGWLWPK